MGYYIGNLAGKQEIRSTVRGMGLVAAQRLGVHKVSRGLKSSGPTAATYPLELTGTAFTPQLVVIPQGPEDLGVIPDLCK